MPLRAEFEIFHKYSVAKFQSIKTSQVRRIPWRAWKITSRATLLARVPGVADPSTKALILQSS